MPRVSLVGNGHGGSQDYATLSLWAAAEFGIDYGSRIEAQCLGDCGANTTLNGSNPYPPLITTLSVQYDGTNHLSLALLKSLNLQTPVTLSDMRVQEVNSFVASLTPNALSDNSLIERNYITHSNASGVDAVTLAGSCPNTVFRNNILNGGVNGIDFGFNFVLNCENTTVFNATGDGLEGSGSNGTQTNCFSFNNAVNDYFSVTSVNCASEDLTGSSGLTGYTSSELVDFANGDYRTKATSTLATAGQGGTFIGAFLEASSGLTASITESGPSFTEQISATLSKAIQASITELGPSFTESISTNLSANITGSIGESGPAFTESISATLSTLTIQGNITESGPSFTDSISVDVQASLGLSASITELGPSFTESVQASLDKAIEANISEYGPSFTDSISISLTSEIDASIGEYGPSFIEGLSAKIPVKISVNAKNTIKVKRSANTVKIKRKSNILRVK